MEIKKKISPCEYITEASFSKEKIELFGKEIISEQNNKIKVAGFRPGKAPDWKVREYLEQKGEWDNLLGIKIQQDFIQEWDQTKENETGEITRILDIQIKNQEPLDLEIKVEVFPKVESKDLEKKYKQIKIEKKTPAKDIAITEEEMEKELELIQKKRTILKPSSENLGKDKFAFLSFIFPEDKEQKENANKDLFAWGNKQYGSEFDKETENLKEGDEKEIEIKNLDQEETSHLKRVISSLNPEILKDSPKEIKFKIKVGKIFLSETPKLDDEFAKSLGKFNSLEELKNSISEGLRLEKLYKEKSDRREALVQELLKCIELSVPETLIKTNAEQSKAYFEDKMAENMGMSRDELIKKRNTEEEKEIETAFQERAKNELKLNRIIETIAIKEKIVPKDKEIEDEIKLILSSFSSTQEAKKVLGDSEDFKSRVIISLCHRKTLDFLEQENKLLDDVEEEIKKIEGEQEK